MACSKPGGRFIINSGIVAESILPGTHPEKSYHPEGSTMQVINEYVVNSSFLFSHLKYTKNNHTEVHSFKHYVYSLGEIKRLLDLFGFNLVALYNAVAKTLSK